MGYRHYFYLVDIEECNKVKNMTYTELIKHIKNANPDAVEEDADGVWINFHEALNQKEIFEFGKLYYEDTADRIYSHGAPLFLIEDTQEYFEDYQPYRMGKDGLLEAIKIYEKKIIDYYEDLAKDGAVQILPFGIEVPRDDIKSVDKLREHAEDMLRRWKWGAINLNEESDSISSSWLYEHQIFELVRLYKAIDWDKKCLLFYGY